MVKNQRLISTGASNAYMHAILLIVTGSGLLYVTGALPAYDPSVIAVPRGISFTDYLGLAAGGLIVYVGLFTALWNRVTCLYIQLFGLLVQAFSALILAVVVEVWAPFGQTLFILLISAVVLVVHAVRIRQIVREIRQAPAKIEASKSIFADGAGATA